MTNLPESVNAVNSIGNLMGFEAIEMLDSKCENIENSTWVFSDGSTATYSDETFYAFAAK